MNNERMRYIYNNLCLCLCVNVSVVSGWFVCASVSFCGCMYVCWYIACQVITMLTVGMLVFLIHFR